MSRQHTVTLSPEQRTTLEHQRKRRTTPHRARMHCRILLLADTTQSGYLTDEQIGAQVGCSARSVARVRTTFATRGLDDAIARKARSDRPKRLLTAEQEARVIALALEATPAGQPRWSVRALAQEVVAQGMVPAISRETIRRTLKKTAVRPG